MLTQIQNAQKAKHPLVEVLFSKFNLEVARLLKEANFLEDVQVKKKRVGPKETEFSYIEIKPSYTAGLGAIQGVDFISKPSRRIYAHKSDLKPIKSGYGLAVISTSKGVMSGETAKKAGLGGEVIFYIW